MSNIKDFALFINSPIELRHVDEYSALGDIYHGANILALCVNASPEVVEVATIVKDIYNDRQDFGLEKRVSDLLVAYRAPQIRKILNKYEI